MYHWVEDKDFLKRAYSVSADLVNRLVQELKKHGIDSEMYVIGSKLRNMITQNEKEAIDFDFNLLIHDADRFWSAKELKDAVKAAFDVVLRRNKRGACDDSTSALTTKKIRFPQGNKTEFSVDVCIVKRDFYGNLHRLIHQKTGYVQFDQWYWNIAPDVRDLQEKSLALKTNPKDWNQVRETYLVKKNMYLRRGDDDHTSFVCYIEAVNEVYYKDHDRSR